MNDQMIPNEKEASPDEKGRILREKIQLIDEVLEKEAGDLTPALPLVKEYVDRELSRLIRIRDVVLKDAYYDESLDIDIQMLTEFKNDLAQDEFPYSLKYGQHAEIIRVWLKEMQCVFNWRLTVPKERLKEFDN